MTLRNLEQALFNRPHLAHLKSLSKACFHAHVKWSYLNFLRMTKTPDACPIIMPFERRGKRTSACGCFETKKVVSFEIVIFLAVSKLYAKRRREIFCELVSVLKALMSTL